MTTKWICEKRLFKDTWIKNLTSDTRMQISDGSVPGLYLRYLPGTRNISFYLNCFIRSTGQQKNLFLGRLYDFENVDQVKEKARKQKNSQAGSPAGLFVL